MAVGEDEVCRACADLLGIMHSREDCVSLLDKWRGLVVLKYHFNIGGSVREFLDLLNGSGRLDDFYNDVVQLRDSITNE